MSTTYQRRTVVRSTSSRRPAQPPPPPKKKKRTGLIIGIIIGAVVLLIIIIVIIILLTRNKTTNPGTSCTSNANCTGGKVCNTTTGVCVTCLTDSQCSGSTPKCKTSTGTCVGCNVNSDCGAGLVCNSSSNTCVGGPCTTGADCTSAGFPVCVTGTCRQCSTNVNCSSNTIYSSQGKNTCNLANFTCVQCDIPADCPTAPNATCSNNVCCDVTPPTIAPLTATLAADSSITGTFSWTQPATGLTATRQLQARAASVTGSISSDNLTVTAVAAGSLAIEVGDFVTGLGVLPGTIITQIPVGGGMGVYKISRPQTIIAGILLIDRIIYQTTAAVPDGTILLVQSTMNQLLFPQTQYSVVIKLITPCGTAYSAPSVVTMPISTTDFVTGPASTTGDKNGTIQGMLMSGPPTFWSALSTVNTRVAMIVSKNQGIHPNLVGTGSDNGHIVRNLPPSAATYLVVQYTAPWAGPPPVGGAPTEPIAGSTWYSRILIDNTDPNSIILGNISAEFSGVVAAS